MAAVSCIWQRRQSRWFLVANTDKAQFTAECIETVSLMLERQPRAFGALRRYVQHLFQGRAKVVVERANGHQWLVIALAADKIPCTMAFIQQQLQRAQPQHDLASLLALFSSPVALVNCRTGRSLTNTAWRRKHEGLDPPQAAALASAMRQLCRATPANNSEFALDEEQGLLLLRQRGQRVGAWRLMVWYRGKPHQTEPLGNLSNAERRVCRALQEGLSVQQVAERQAKSIHTIRTQLRNSYKKLRVNNQADLLLKLKVAPQILQ